MDRTEKEERRRAKLSIGLKAAWARGAYGKLPDLKAVARRLRYEENRRNRTSTEPYSPERSARISAGLKAAWARGAYGDRPMATKAKSPGAIKAANRLRMDANKRKRRKPEPWD